MLNVPEMLSFVNLLLNGMRNTPLRSVSLTLWFFFTVRFAFSSLIVVQVVSFSVTLEYDF